MKKNGHNQKVTPISDIGEFGLIDRLTKTVKLHSKHSDLGIGDDAAVLESNQKKVIISVDTYSEGVHFDFRYSPLKHLGYKIITASISDIIAMNALPTQVLVSLAVSHKISVETLENIYQGINTACGIYKLDFVGGETTSTTSGLVITVTVVGYADSSEIKARSQAKQDDLICVTGNLGAAYMGLQILEREKHVIGSDSIMQPNFEGYEYLIERQLKPEAQKWLVPYLKQEKIKVNAMIDISDGLFSELLHICSSSQVGCSIYENKIPIHPQTLKAADEFNLSSLVVSANGGEDYEILFTVPLSEHEKIEKASDIMVIGHITGRTEGCYVVLEGSEEKHKIKAQGWNHFDVS